MRKAENGNGVLSTFIRSDGTLAELLWRPAGGITIPFDGQPATVGNGVMIALAASSKEQVDKLYAKAMSLGATDEGKPGARMDNFYAAYFRDLDGNKLNFFYMG